MRENGLMIHLKEKENLFSLMETFMMENGKTVFPKAMGSMLVKIQYGDTKAIGRVECKMEKANNHSKTDHATREILRKV